MPKKSFMDVYEKHYDRATERSGDPSSWRAELESIQETEEPAPTRRDNLDPELRAQAAIAGGNIATNAGRRLRKLRTLKKEESA